MAKRDDGPAWVDRLKIGKACHLVGMCRGMITLTRTDDGTHTLWIFDYPLASGPDIIIRTMYADYLKGDWLEKYYRHY